jgi:transcriptional regulator with XRE-family HTH domain
VVFLSGPILRAAFAYKGMKVEDRAALLGVSARHLSRIQGDAGGFEVDDDLLADLAEQTGAPSWFLRHGFTVAPQPEEPTLAERVEALENKLDALLRERSKTTPADALGKDLVALYEEQDVKDVERESPVPPDPQADPTPEPAGARRGRRTRAGERV